MADLSANAVAVRAKWLEALSLAEKDLKTTALVARHVDDTVGAACMAFHDDDDTVSDATRFLNALATLLINLPITETMNIRKLQSQIDGLISKVDDIVNAHVDDVLHEPAFKLLESNWLGLSQLYADVTSDNVFIDFVAVTKDELANDLDEHVSDILTSALFKKIYVDEYDRYGGQPFGAMIGYYEFDSSEGDVEFLRTISRVCAAAHLPFIAAAGVRFFDVSSYDELAAKGDLTSYMTLPKFGKFNGLRDDDYAAYIGLTLPRYMMRSPWPPKPGATINYAETISSKEDYLWGNSANLMARNMVRSFQLSEWCQHIRGPKGGGEIKGLSSHTFLWHEREEIQPPVEFEVPDYMELTFASNGFIALVNKKNSADCCFFSVNSIKRAVEFVDQIDTQNAALVCNLAYTLSVTRIAHYVQRMVRDYIGSTADAPYIQNMLSLWLSDYVTIVSNPDDLTLSNFPFKAVTVTVVPKPGPLGWYKGVVSVLPHVQFEGMDVELRLEAALGGSK